VNLLKAITRERRIECLFENLAHADNGRYLLDLNTAEITLVVNYFGNLIYLQQDNRLTHPLFKKYPEKLANKKNDLFPITDYICKHHICLPIYPGLQEEEIKYVVNCLKKVL